MNRKGKPRRSRDEVVQDQRLEACDRDAGGKFEDRTVLRAQRGIGAGEKPKAMPIKFYNPTSAGRRAGSVIDYKAVLTKFEPEPSLVSGRLRANGRNHHGVITAKHRGGGNKKLYRIIDFKRTARTAAGDGGSDRIRSESERSHRIDSSTRTGTRATSWAPNGLKVGAKVVSGPDSPPELGNCIPLANIPTGLEIHNIEMNPGQGGKLVRSAGGVARLERQRRRVGGGDSAVSGKCGEFAAPAGRRSDNWGIWTGST